MMEIFLFKCRCFIVLRSGGPHEYCGLFVMFKTPDWDCLSFIIMLYYPAENGNERDEHVRNNAQVYCGTLLDCSKCAKEISPYHCTTGSSLNHWVQAFVLFMPNSASSIWMLQQEWWPISTGSLLLSRFDKLVWPVASGCCSQLTGMLPVCSPVAADHLLPLNHLTFPF